MNKANDQLSLGYAINSINLTESLHTVTYNPAVILFLVVLITAN